jgi:hypothetical protein
MGEELTAADVREGENNIELASKTAIHPTK